MLKWLNYFNKWSQESECIENINKCITNKFFMRTINMFCKDFQCKSCGEETSIFLTWVREDRCLPRTCTGWNCIYVVLKSMHPWELHMLSTLVKSLCITHCNISLVSPHWVSKFQNLPSAGKYMLRPWERWPADSWLHVSYSEVLFLWGEWKVILLQLYIKLISPSALKLSCT